MHRAAEAETAAAAASAAVIRADVASATSPLVLPAVRWLMPCRIKDVAGLVPGASDYRGRGNAFLNDLCDADVLVHVVDASGLSDDDGNILLAAAAGLHDMHGDAPSSNSHNDHWRETVATPQHARERWVWPRDANRVVDEFLKRRFPTLVMLNKADLPGVGERIRRAQDALAAGAAATTPGTSASSSTSSSSSSTLPPPPTVATTAMPACAVAEAWLQRATARGAIAYAPGDASFRLLPPAATSVAVNSGENNDDHDKDGKDEDQSKAERAARVLATLGDTSVLRALSVAILMRPLVVAFPVADLESLAHVIIAVAKQPASQPAQAAIV
ncbi:hypothetical protein HK405_003547, partial [Cladochytrium tenue]